MRTYEITWYDGDNHIQQVELNAPHVQKAVDIFIHDFSPVLAILSIVENIERRT